MIAFYEPFLITEMAFIDIQLHLNGELIVCFDLRRDPQPASCMLWLEAFISSSDEEAAAIEIVLLPMAAQREPHGVI